MVRLVDLAGQAVVEPIQQQVVDTKSRIAGLKQQIEECKKALETLERLKGINLPEATLGQFLAELGNLSFNPEMTSDPDIIDKLEQVYELSEFVRQIQNQDHSEALFANLKLNQRFFAGFNQVITSIIAVLQNLVSTTEATLAKTHTEITVLSARVDGIRNLMRERTTDVGSRNVQSPVAAVVAAVLAADNLPESIQSPPPPPKAEEPKTEVYSAPPDKYALTEDEIRKLPLLGSVFKYKHVGNDVYYFWVEPGCTIIGADRAFIEYLFNAGNSSTDIDTVRHLQNKKPARLTVNKEGMVTPYQLGDILTSRFRAEFCTVEKGEIIDDA